MGSVVKPTWAAHANSNDIQSDSESSSIFFHRNITNSSDQSRILPGSADYQKQKKTPSNGPPFYCRFTTIIRILCDFTEIREIRDLRYLGRFSTLQAVGILLLSKVCGKANQSPDKFVQFSRYIYHVSGAPCTLSWVARREKIYPEKRKACLS